MAKRFLIFALMVIFIVPFYSKKDFLLKRCKCNEAAMVATQTDIAAARAIAKSCNREGASATNEMSLSAPIGQYLTSFE
jgi:hypothetical protein